MPIETADMDDQSLFQAAIADEAPAAPDTSIPDVPQDQTEAPPPGERRRDASGRFAPATPEIPPGVTGQPGAPAPAPSPDGAETVPSWRLREEREAREAYASRLAERDNQLSQALNYLRLLQQQQQAAPAPQAPDPILDPAGYSQFNQSALQTVEQRFANQLRTIQLENNLQLTRMQVGEEIFDDAYAAFMDAGGTDQGFARSIVNSSNPGAAMVNWYRQATTLQRIGNDPEAYLRSHEEALLNDTSFLQRAVERARAIAANPAVRGQAPGRAASSTPSNVVVLPPSLQNIRGGTTAEAGAPGGEHDPMSDAALFNQALRPAGK
jgi:hypothetical protein